MRFFEFSSQGHSYILAAANWPPDGFERVPLLEVGEVLRELEEHGPRAVLDAVLELLGPAFGSRFRASSSLTTPLADFEQYHRLALFRRPWARPAVEPAELAPVDLADLAGEVVDISDHFIEVEILDSEGEPVAGFEVEIELPEGAVRICRTNLFGCARVEGIPKAGTCKVMLPELDPDDVPDGPRPPRSWLEFDVVDENGMPYTDLELSVECPDGEVRQVKTDAQGMVRLEGIAEGLCTITHPGESAPAEA